MDDLILPNVPAGAKYDAIQDGIYLSMISFVEMKLMKKYESEEMENKLNFTFRLIRNVTGGEVTDIKGKAFKPMQRSAWKTATPSFFFSKNGVKELTQAGKILKAAGLNPFENPVNLKGVVGKYVILVIENAPSKANPSVIKDKITSFMEFNGNEAEIDEIVARANAEYQESKNGPAYDDEESFNKAAAPKVAPATVETTLDEEIASMEKEEASKSKK